MAKIGEHSCQLWQNVTVNTKYTEKIKSPDNMLVCPYSGSGLGLRFRRETNWNKELNGDTVHETSSLLTCAAAEGGVIPYSDRVWGHQRCTAQFLFSRAFDQSQSLPKQK